MQRAAGAPVRIISDSHDYYDSIQGYGGYDGSLTFVRNQREELIPTSFRGLSSPRWWWGGVDDLQRYSYRIIGFCGEVFPVLVYTVDNRDLFCYSVDDVDKYVEQHANKAAKNAYVNATRRKYVEPWRKTITNHFAYYAANRRRHSDLFDQLSAPQFVARMGPYTGDNNWYLEVNKPLREFDFFRVKDPFSAYQDMVAYVSNQAAPEKPIPQPSDSDKAQLRGFNKFSFRKDKSR